MSIFKSTLNSRIAAQLKAREKIILSDVRTDNFLRFTTGKNSWIRMTSFVNYDSKIFNAKTGKLDNDSKYNGDSLSKKYVLEGGTLYDKGNGKFDLRSGVGKLDGVYASNIDKISSNPSDNKVDRLYGLRPMPGITSANIINKNAYGSLREATVQFMAWDKHQLEELEILFMRVGYTVFLEWGWSQYIDHDVPTSINEYPNVKGVKNFDGQTLNPFDSGLTEDKIYNRIEDDILKYNGNYDALLGYVKNFSWQLLPNGGFQCSTTLISRGEVIETIKASANTNIILGSNLPTATISPGVDQQKPVLSNFEKIFLNIAAKINETEYVQAFNYGAGTTSITGELYLTGSTTDDQKVLRDQSDAIYSDIRTRLSKGIFVDVVGSWDNYKINYAGTTGLNLDTSCVIKFCDGKTQGTGIEYININAFIAIINEFFLIKNKKTNRPIVTIVLPFSTPCLASEDSVSIDPTTCIIKNSKAKLVTNQTKGFDPELFINVDASSLTPGAVAQRANIPEFLTDKTNVGQIGNIFISISKIIQLYRNLSGGPDGVDVLTLMQDVLDACSFALGGINDFKLYTNRNIVQVIDVKYFENASRDSKFKFDLIGLKSICRDVKINSRIFAEQSSMIGIAAGVSGNDFGNLGDIYSSTQTYFNRGLTDRIISATYDDASTPSITYGGTTITGEEAYYVNIFKNIDMLTNYINRNVTGESNPQGSVGWKVTVVPQENEVVNAGSLLKTFHYQINGKDVDFKALIPFELEITLDGIGGFIVGQIFVIDKTILPRDYYNKNLGFIITGINHSLQNNDWVTNIKTQICLLDNDKINDRAFVDREKLRKLIETARAEQAENGYLYCALADFMISQYVFSLTVAKDGTVRDPDFDLIMSLDSNPKKIFNIEYSTGFFGGDNIDEVKPRIQRIVDYINDRSFIETYLRNWHAIGLTKGAPGFPATYEKFIEPSGTASGTWNQVIDNITNLIRSRTPLSIAVDLDNVGKGAWWDKATTETVDELYYQRIKNGTKNAWNGTFYGKIQNGNDNFLFPLAFKGTNTTIKHVPYDKVGGLENQSFSVKNSITTTGGGAGGTGVGGTTITTIFGIDDDTFNQLFLIFYAYLRNNNAALGLSAYGAPQVTDVRNTSASFNVIHIEGTTK